MVNTIIFLDIPLRAALALSRLVRDREAYTPQIHPNTPVLHVNPTGLLGREEAGEELAAKNLADKLLTCCGVGVDEAHAMVERAGKGWDQPGLEIFTTDCLRPNYKGKQKAPADLISAVPSSSHQHSESSPLTSLE
jgi:hypothetical protein